MFDEFKWRTIFKIVCLVLRSSFDAATLLRPLSISIYNLEMIYAIFFSAAFYSLALSQIFQIRANEKLFQRN